LTLSPDEQLVVDASVAITSVAIKWVVAEAGNERAIALRHHSLIAPDLLFAECANVLWRKMRRREIAEAEAVTAARTLELADLIVISARGNAARAIAIATELDHPAYDAIYLAVAEAFGVRLVTADDRLIRKTEQSTVRFREMLVPLSEIPPAGYSA
jgi:predicted nucleic acid-binding protein